MTAERIVITAGEPAGIGPDLCIQLAQSTSEVERVVVADGELLESRARMLGLPLKLHAYRPTGEPRPQERGELTLLPVPLASTVTPGALNPANAPYVLETLRRAMQGCLTGEFAGLVTAPLHKGVINEAGIPFTGHTEFLARESGVETVVMMLATEGLRVALVTTHLPLHEVASAITPSRLEKVLRVLDGQMARYFCTARPRILVCGLNPHAGEGGHLGSEEETIIRPVLKRLQGEGMCLQGPLAADTAFLPERLKEYDVVLTMYHDQGLPVLKHMGFGRAANITLGLPFIRTSVDHGTALELAGSGKADAGSLHHAMETALTMRRNALQKENQPG